MLKNKTLYGLTKSRKAVEKSSDYPNVFSKRMKQILESGQNKLQTRILLQLQFIRGDVEHHLKNKLQEYRK